MAVVSYQLVVGRVSVSAEVLPVWQFQPRMGRKLIATGVSPWTELPVREAPKGRKMPRCGTVVPSSNKRT